MLPRSIAALLFLSAAVFADDGKTQFGGHTKFSLTGQSYPSQSLFRDLVGNNTLDVSGDLRLNFTSDAGRWSFDAAYQLQALNGDSVELGRALPGGTDIFFPGLPDDDRRLFDLTDIIEDDDKLLVLHRVDRLTLRYASEKAVIRFGRQALSWGNGLFYAPMDLVNPFDPAAIDTEYKIGDDMLYVQYLRDSGDDVQGAYVLRRNLSSGDVEVDSSTAAVKYHGFAGEAEFDLLMAQSYGDPVVGVGGSKSIGGAIWRGDIVTTRTDADTYVQMVTNLTYSWNWFDRNMSGAIEYFYNGFGQRSNAYDALSLANNPDLVRRVTRGELFSIGRHYLAASVLIEVTPLWTLTPTVLANVSDPSGLFQLVTNYSVSDNMSLLASINVPLGPKGTEFGGIESDMADRYLSGGAGLFAQFAWYF
ncbi:MAG: hypothetical protein KJO27_06535 [Gammaproteobacteria bacterium]|nr:hypothetical protein [Gammaproteobacteria bacterium]MBT8110364.1 hypothetical protein [Gammaproteobacteria bacterium]NNL45067.1 hypothetical protein [Woeseiaceae bacterium]